MRDAWDRQTRRGREGAWERVKRGMTSSSSNGAVHGAREREREREREELQGGRVKGREAGTCNSVRCAVKMVLLLLSSTEAEFSNCHEPSCLSALVMFTQCLYEVP